jgi:hypothetical protein
LLFSLQNIYHFPPPPQLCRPSSRHATSTPAVPLISPADHLHTDTDT